ncbi:type II toxin-antitoxin system HigB family toxin [Azospirillum sp. SYSU D00513]|uniref:type II toxin-antitoxin system HigB family toxin n=1 Tax=Azospirillum sp. SYSU D00513 TaxID=2812561 RepID=UPI001A973A46|nr:type II toxin-antitoxin system HigB family toxin [Azospirillum sp. SYSU D00513]
MRIISRRTLREHWERPGRSDSEGPLSDWYNIVRRSEWSNPATLKDQFRSASFVGDRVVFNIAGNKYRLVAGVDYQYRTVYVKWVGTHREYDDIDVKEV